MRHLLDEYCSECQSRLATDLSDLQRRESGEAGSRPGALEWSATEIGIRCFAAFLALIGSFFGVLLFAIFHWEGDPLRVIAFVVTAGPGYLVTAGYFWRVVAHPSYQWRVGIWIASSLVQGAWLVISLIDDRPSPAMLWWLVSCIGSAVAMTMEP